MRNSRFEALIQRSAESWSTTIVLFLGNINCRCTESHMECGDNPALAGGDMTKDGNDHKVD